MNVFEILLILMENGALMVEVFNTLLFTRWLGVPGFNFSVFELFINPFALVALFTLIGVKKLVPLL